MREYIFYVLLVFLPIGAFMVRILHDQGLPTKNIAYIVLTSLAIVVTFPISMERLGILLAFSVYAIILFLIILYMVKITDNICVDTVASQGSSDGKVDNKILQDQNNKIDLEITAPDILESQPESSSLDRKNVNLANMVLKIDENELTTKDIINKTTIDDMKLPKENKKKEDVILDIKEDTNENINVELNNNQAEKESSNIENNEPMANNLELEATEIKEVQEVQAVKIEEIEGPKEEILEVENIPQELETNSPKGEEVKIQKALSEELVSYIDDAFLYKTEGNTDKAIEKFLLIWENSKDLDLKHLVTLELLEMYKTAGLYNLAQELLTQFYNEVKDINTYMAPQLHKELTYIMLLNDEITRLGLEKVPFDKLPRWVKIKVADELNQLD